MILGEVFERFIAESPFCVMLRMLLEQSLLAQEIDELFEQQAERQYHRELLFSTIVNLMSLVVCGISPSLNAAYQAKAKDIGVTLSTSSQQAGETQAEESELRQLAEQRICLSLSLFLIISNYSGFQVNKPQINSGVQGLRPCVGALPPSCS